MPPKSLSLHTGRAGCERVKFVSVHVAARQLSYWDTGGGAWKLLTGRRPVYVGASSRDIRLTGAADISGKLAIKRMLIGASSA